MTEVCKDFYLAGRDLGLMGIERLVAFTRTWAHVPAPGKRATACGLDYTVGTTGTDVQPEVTYRLCRRCITAHCNAGQDRAVEVAL